MLVTVAATIELRSCKWWRNREIKDQQESNLLLLASNNGEITVAGSLSLEEDVELSKMIFSEMRQCIAIVNFHGSIND